MDAVAGPRVVDVAAVVFRVPVVEGYVVGRRESHTCAALPKVLAVEVDRGLAHKLIGAALRHDDGVEHTLALELSGGALVEALHSRGEVAVDECGFRATGHTGEGAPAVYVDGVREVNQTIADGDVDIRPSHHTGTVLTVEVACKRAAVYQEAARVHGAYQTAMCGIMEYAAAGLCRCKEAHVGMAVGQRRFRVAVHHAHDTAGILFA